jgi:hypothetical protein
MTKLSELRFIKSHGFKQVDGNSLFNLKEVFTGAKNLLYRPDREQYNVRNQNENQSSLAKDEREFNPDKTGLNIC